MITTTDRVTAGDGQPAPLCAVFVVVACARRRQIRALPATTRRCLTMTTLTATGVTDRGNTR